MKSAALNEIGFGSEIASISEQEVSYLVVSYLLPKPVKQNAAGFGQNKSHERYASWL